MVYDSDVDHVIRGGIHEEPGHEEESYAKQGDSKVRVHGGVHWTRVASH